MSGENPEAQDIRNIKQVIEGSWATPATIKWGTLRVIERAPGGWLHGEATFDAQNRFGALIRSHVDVIYQVRADTLYWNKEYGVQDLGDSNTQISPETLMDTFKALNGWPKK